MHRKSIAYLVVIGLLLTAAAMVLRESASAAGEKQLRSSPEQPLDVSIIQLIARPDDFDGEYVRFYGFYRSEFEGTAIYLHREDDEHALSRNGLWVNHTDRELDQKHVLLDGRFSAKRRGHMGMWSGEIDDVRRMVLWGIPQPRPARQRDAPAKAQ